MGGREKERAQKKRCVSVCNCLCGVTSGASTVECSSMYRVIDLAAADENSSIDAGLRSMRKTASEGKQSL